MRFAMWGTVSLLALGAIAYAGSQSSPAPREYPLDRLPSALVPAAADADSTFALLQRRLGARLMSELASKGAAGAISVCRDSAEVVTTEITKATGVEVGRTSRRLRNPDNAPPAWAKRYVDAVAEGTPATAVKPMAFDLGERVGILRPIPTQKLCLQCHGAADSLSQDLARAVRETYPEDRAVGYHEGDLRGFMWAEAPKRR